MPDEITTEQSVAPMKHRSDLKLFEKYVTDLDYFMEPFLVDALDQIPKFFLKNAWDCVFIVSGHGKVRIGKSTLAMQMAYYLAYIMKKPFTNDNVVYSPDDLMEKANKLPDHSIIVYDEGRAGLDSARAMENINKTMQDFFQQCGAKGHVIIIVLPNFFKLSETIAVDRSLFLVDVYCDQNYKRGRFSFFNEYKKELLYIIGKKKWGTANKYLCVQHNFHGRFSDFFPIDKKIYDERKALALKRTRKISNEARYKAQRAALAFLYQVATAKTSKEIAKDIREVCPNAPIHRRMLEYIIKSLKRKVELVDYEEDPEDLEEKIK